MDDHRLQPFAKMLTDRLLTYACGHRSLLEAVVTSDLFRSR